MNFPSANYQISPFQRRLAPGLGQYPVVFGTGASQYSANEPVKAEKQEQKGKHAKTVSTHAAQNEDASIWRDTALRYGGYADEVGEFLGPYLGGVGKFLGYGVSSLYVLADMGTTLPKKYKNASPELTRWQKIRKTGAEAVDLGVFHGVATLLVPPMIIGGGAHFVDKHLTSNASKYGKFVQNNPRLQRIAKKQAEWANKNLQPGLARAGKSLARMMEPLERQVAKSNPDFIKRIPIFGGLLENLSGDLKDLRQLDKFNFNQKNVIKLLLQKPIPVAIGIGMVPLIAHPFDKLMLKVQDWTIRPLMGINKIVKDENGKRKSVKNPTFWGHQKQPVAHVEPHKSAVPGTVAFPHPMVKRGGSQALHAQARFGYYQPLPNLAPNPLYPKLPAFPVSLPSQPMYYQYPAYTAITPPFALPVAGQ